MDPNLYALCKDAYCIPSKDRVGESDEGELAQAFADAYREYLGDGKFGLLLDLKFQKIAMGSTLKC